MVLTAFQVPFFYRTAFDYILLVSKYSNSCIRKTYKKNCSIKYLKTRNIFMPLQAKKPSQFTMTMLGYSPLSCQTAFFNDTICFNFLTFKPQKIETIYFVEQVRLSSFNTPKKAKSVSVLSVSFIILFWGLIHIHIHKKLDIATFPIRQLY